MIIISNIIIMLLFIYLEQAKNEHESAYVLILF